MCRTRHYNQRKSRTILQKAGRLATLYHAISAKSNLMSLSPIMGRDGLLRVGGRLSQANLSLSQTHPIILCSKSTIVLLLFNYNHVTLGHCGPTLLLASTGTRLHVVGARLLARSMCRQGVTCRRVSAKMENQMMGQLPAQLTPSYPFQITGVDYAGPFTVKKGYTRKPTMIKLSVFPARQSTSR